MEAVHGGTVTPRKTGRTARTTRTLPDPYRVVNLKRGGVSLAIIYVGWYGVVRVVHPYFGMAPKTVQMAS